MISMFKFLVEGLALNIVGCIGISGNLVCIIYFSIKEGKSNFHQLMQCLAGFDLMYVILSIVMFGVPSTINGLSDTEEFKRLFTRLLPFAQIGLTGSIYMTLAIAIERYTTVCHPFFKLYHSWSARMYILPIIIFSILFNVPKFFELRVSSLSHEPLNTSNLNTAQTNTLQDNFTRLTADQSGCINNGFMEQEPDDLDLLRVLCFSNESIEMDKMKSVVKAAQNNPNGIATKEFAEKQVQKPVQTINPTINHSKTAQIVPTELRIDPLYIKVYLVYLNMGIHCIFPLVSLVILNLAVYRKMREMSKLCGGVDQTRNLMHQQEIRLSQVSLLIVLVFITCHSVRWIPNIFELADEWPPWLTYFSEISHLCMTFNSSVNFYIYEMKHGGCWKLIRKTRRTRSVILEEETTNFPYNTSIAQQISIESQDQLNLTYQECTV